MKLLLPERKDGQVIGYPINHERGKRFYFLGGPIQGGDDWQAEAIKLLMQKDPDCYIVCPCRYNDSDELYKFLWKPQGAPLLFQSQTKWERYYLHEAAIHGCVIFWLPVESKTKPRKKEDGPYGRETYGELGRWSMSSACTITPNHHKFFDPEKPKHVNIAIGAEFEFPGLKQIQDNFNEDHQGRFLFHSSLEFTITEAVRLGKEVSPQPFGFND